MRLNFILTLSIVLASLCYSQCYYPFEIGSRWDYGYLDTPGHFVYQRTVSVTGDTVMPNGKRYSVLSDGSYLRQQGDTVYGYSSVRGEIVVYDFSRQNGDTIKTYYSYDTMTTVVYRGQGTVFGKSRTVWTFYTVSSASTFNSLINIADSIGYIYGEWEPGENEYCLGAIINGVQYGTITGVPPSDDLFPTRISLAQNYPNPFNPTTNFGFRIANFGFVSLKVYDVLGREMATLVNEVKQPGEYTVMWDASKMPRQNAGGLASGVYFYRLQAHAISTGRDGNASSFSETKKLLLLK